MQIAIEELCQICTDLQFTKYDVEKAFQKLDIDKTGLITYTQFLIATLPKQAFSDDSILERHFKDLDSLTEGFLTK